MRATRARWPTAYCGIAAAKRSTCVSNGRPGRPKASASSACTSLASSPSPIGRRRLAGPADERLQQRGLAGEVAPFRRRPGAGSHEPAVRPAVTKPVPVRQSAAARPRGRRAPRPPPTNSATPRELAGGAGADRARMPGGRPRRGGDDAGVRVQLRAVARRPSRRRRARGARRWRRWPRARRRRRSPASGRARRSACRGRGGASRSRGRGRGVAARAEASDQPLAAPRAR